jgi:hypothetical protein
MALKKELSRRTSIRLFLIPSVRIHRRQRRRRGDNRTQGCQKEAAHHAVIVNFACSSPLAGFAWLHELVLLWHKLPLHRVNPVGRNLKKSTREKVNGETPSGSHEMNSPHHDVTLWVINGGVV